MFKIESYITPYILAYLDKYFKNFNPSNFQVSLWAGGASFNNLDLNLEVLEEEFHLPVTFVSGHIHELRLFVPWTKITYEPIVVNVNTIEITLKLKSGKDEGDGEGRTSKSVRESVKPSKEPEEPPGYVQNLINKMITNIRIDCQNVIVKLVEEDIVFTLNVKTASLFPTNENWKSSFIDLIAPEFTLRRQLTFSDLTVCLDQTNSAGKIEQYLEPLLYRCSFDVRILQKYHSQFAARPFFTRMDIYSEEMKFTITDEQIPMLLKLYHMLLTVKNNLKSSSAASDSLTSACLVDQTAGDCEAPYEEDDDQVMNWATWAVGWIPDIPATIFGAVEAEDELDEFNVPETTSHLGFYVNKAVIVFKGMEGVTEQKNSRGAPRIRFQPFLRCSVQGMICDMVQRTLDTNIFAGISQILLEGVQACPCGMKDCVGENFTENRNNQYLRIGEVNRDFANGGLFEDCFEVKPPNDNIFQFENRSEVLTEEMMLNRAPAVAVEYLDVTGDRNEDTKSHYSGSSVDGYDLGRDKLLCRLVIAPCTVKLCSGSIHRLKMILFSANQNNYEAVCPQKTKQTKHGEGELGHSVDFGGVKNIESAFNIYQFTVFRPYVEIVAGDHLDFDQQTHVRAKHKKRKATTITPLSDFLPEWPRIIITFSCIDGRIMDPNSRFRKLMAKAQQAPDNVIDLFAYKITAKVFSGEAKLRSDKFVVPVCIPFNVEFNFSSCENPDVISNNFNPVSRLEVLLDDFRLNLAKPHLMLLQVILISCYDERMSEHLTCSTILRDLPAYNQGDIVVHISEFSIQAVFTRVLHTVRARVGSVGIFIHSPSYPSPIPIFEGPPNNRPDPEGLAVIILQYPLKLLDEFAKPDFTISEGAEVSNKANEMTPIIIVNISEFLVQFEPIFFQWLSYHPRQMPSSIPADIQTSNQILYPMVPVSRTSSRMSVISKVQSSWSASDENNVIGSVTGEDFQQLYQSPKPTLDDQSTHESSHHSYEVFEDTCEKRRRKSTLEEEFQLRFAPRAYIETWNKWVVTHLAVIMKSFIIVNVGQGDIWFPIGQQSFVSFSEERNSNGVLVTTPKLVALPQGPKVQSLYSQLPLPVPLPQEYSGRELYPLRITAENFTLSTVQTKEGKLPFSLPLNVLLTLTLTEKKSDGKPSVIAAFLHSDIPTVKLSLSFAQINLLLRLTEQFLQTTALILRHSGSLMLGTIDSNNEFQKSDSDPMIEKRRIDPASVISGNGKDGFAKQHHRQETMSLSELEHQNLAESSVTSSQKQNEGLFATESTPQQEAKTSFWIQVTLAQFQLIIINSPSFNHSPADQFVFELEDIVSSLDIQPVFVKWALKIGNVSLRRYERTTQDRWDVGSCSGIIMSSGDEITRDINILKGSRKRQHSLSLSASGSASPVHGPKVKQCNVVSHTGSKNRGILTFTYTQVQTKNFHKKSEMYSPVARWNAAINKFKEKNKEIYDTYDHENSRYLSEFDVKIGSLDFLVDLSNIHPFVKILNALGSIKFVEYDTPVTVMPYYSNTTLPLIYLETGNVRLFLKTTLTSNSRSDTPDVLVLQVASLTIHSQSENPLNRTVVNKELYRLAEHTNILTVPGSPVEDRQYQMDLADVLVYTCMWNTIKANSRELLPKPTTTILKTMGENPALEWNTVRSDTVTEEVVGHPILGSLDLGIAFAPAIVYEGKLTDITKHVVVAGHSLEFNASSEVCLYANLHQLACIQGIRSDLVKILNDCTLGSMMESKEEIVAFNFFQESDSGIDSIITTVSAIDRVFEIPNQKSSEILNVIKEGEFHQGISAKPPEAVPFDLLVTGSMFQVMTYDLKYKHTSGKGKTKSNIVAIVPLAFCVFGQPHLVLSISEANQRAEVSIFELFIGFSPAEKRTVHQFALPDLNDFPDRLFECTRGERDPKTGMIPAFFTAKFTDFWIRPAEFTCDVARPLKISLSRRIIKNWLRIQSYFDSINWEEIRSDKCDMDGSFATECANNSSEQPLMGLISSGKISFNQVVFAVTEEVEEDIPRSSAALSFSGCSIIMRSRMKSAPIDREERVNPDNAYVEVDVSSITLTSGIGARRDIIMTPWDLHMKARIRWKPWRLSPNITASFSADPLSLYVGPQNLLAFLQLHQTFGNYLLDFIAYQEEKIEKIMQTAPGEEIFPPEDYQDDLRSGTFRYVRKDSSNELPEVYQIAFCETDRAMTWRYPHKRILTRVESLPVPIDSDLVPSIKNKELPCIVEYFDDAQNKFCHYGVIYLSESSRGSMRIPEKDKWHLYTSTVWRVVLESPLNESDSLNLVKPDVLAASLRVDSLQDASLNPRLKLYFDVPKVSLHFLNQLTYAGKTPCNLLKSYSFGGLTSPDQPFATLELNANTLLVSLWLLKCKMDFNSYLKFSVTEYGYLTDVPVVEPFTFQLLFHLLQKSANENKTSLKLQMSTKPITIKLSTSVLHTLTASLSTWLQVLETYNGYVVEFTSFQNKKMIHLSEILICNDLHADILVNQIKSEDSKLSVNAETFQSIGCRECFSFVWPTQKATSSCKISVRDPDWKASDVISFHKKGHKVLNVAKSAHKLFVNISTFSSCQTMVTISGPFSVLNALDDEIEIALLPKTGGREVTWPIQPRNHGPSRLIQVQDIEHFRFRFIDGNETMPWSPVVTVEEINAEKNRCLAVELYKQDEAGKIKTFSVWCSMVEETIESSFRSLVVISPFFRIRSSLAVPTKVYNSVGRSSPDEIFELKGEGGEQKIDFIGSHKVVHHLTFQSSPKVSLSSPPIPLVPGGPLTERGICSRSINAIISDILNSTEKQIEQVKKEEQWPYVRDDITHNEWVPSIQPDTTVDVGFSSWIEGLPTVLIDVKPWALFINLTDHEIHFSSLKEGENPFGILPVSVFTPPKIKDSFKLGLASQGDIFWSPALEFTEQKSRTEVHNVNDNHKIPLDCFSRLEIVGKNEICYITLETRIRRDILVVAMRSTFSIQNKTDAWILVKGISLQSNKAQGSSDWEDIEDFTLLQPDFQTCIRSKRTPIFSPLLVHSAPDLDISPEEEIDPPIKYLALSCGGPWWFVRLMKFDLIFNNMSASNGLLGKRLAVTIPKFSPVDVENTSKKKRTEPVEDASFPVILSWTAKNGQVWISVTEDLYPQLTIYNFTSKSLFCAQPSSISSIPVSETENFDQYSFIPSNMRGYYTFAGTYASFPEMSLDSAPPLPSLMIANLPEKPRNIPQSIRDSFGYFREKNLIFSGVFEWSKPIRVDGPVQSVQIVDIFGVKVTIEQVGMRRVMYVENLSSVEVSAKDIRCRISECSVGETVFSNNLVGCKNSSGGDSKEISPLALVLETEVHEALVKTRSVGVMAEEEMKYLPAEFVVYVPWFRLIVMDKVNNYGGQQEVLSACFQDLLVEKFSEVKHIKLRALGNEEMQNWTLRICVGDVEVNTPPFEDRKSDFSVILRQDGGYVPLCATHEGLDIFSDAPLNLSENMMIVTKADFGMSVGNGQELLRVNVALEPMEIFVERHLIENVIPIVEDVFRVLDDRTAELSRVSALPILTHDGRNVQEEEISQKSKQQLWNLKNIASKGNLQALDAMLPNLNHNYCGALRRSQIITLQNDLDEINEEIKESRKIVPRECKVVRLNVHNGHSRSVPRRKQELEVGLISRTDKQNNSESRNRTEINVGIIESEETPIEDGETCRDIQCEFNNAEQFKAWDSDTSFVSTELSHLRSRIQKLFIKSPADVDSLLQEFAEPLRLQQVQISSLKIYSTVRFKYGMYLAFDRAPVDIKEFTRNSVVTTHYGMGHAIGQHYWQSIIYGYKNLVTGVGSWEGVGSPTRLVGEVSTGLRDFVVYPYQGIFKGPAGFFLGIGKGCSSMVKHIAVGTLSSVTNGAWTWSRNLDVLTQDDEDRRADVHGVTDGIAQGFASFGVRMLGAVGGIAHYPIQSIIQDGASPRNIAAGVAKGVVSVVTKPVGGALELLAMTGEGILRGTGWTTDNKTRFRPVSEDIQNASSSALKYYTKTIREESEQRVLLIIDASQPEPTNTSLQPTTLVITTENLYVFNSALDEMTLQFPISKLVVAPSHDRNLLCLRIVNQKKPDDYSVAEERVIEFVRGFASSHCLLGAEETTASGHFTMTTQISQKSPKSSVNSTTDDFGNFFVDCSSKTEFINVLNWAKKIFNGDFYKSN